MNLIDRLIAKEFFFYFFLCVLVFAALYLGIDFLTNIWKPSGTMTQMLELYFYKSLDIALQMVPIAVLMSTLVVLGNFSKNNELIAMLFSGVSLYRVAAVLLVSVFAIVSVNYFLDGTLVPYFKYKQNYVRIVKIQKEKYTPEVFNGSELWTKGKNYFCNINLYLPDKKIISGLTVFYYDADFSLTQELYGRTARFLDDNMLEILDGRSTVFRTTAVRGRAGGLPASEFPVTKEFDRKVIRLFDSPADLARIESNIETLPAGKLRDLIGKQKAMKTDTTSLEITYHSKLAYMVLPLIMLLIGIPFGMTFSTRQKVGALKNSGFCFIVAIIYWVLFNVGLNVAKGGMVPAWLAANAMNLLYLVFGIYFFRKKVTV